MDLFKQLREIEEHFKNISKEELHHNLLEAGLGQIEPSAYSDMRLVSKVELEKFVNKNNYIYALHKSTNYKFNEGLDIYKNELSIDEPLIVQVEVVA